MTRRLITILLAGLMISPAVSAAEVQDTVTVTAGKQKKKKKEVKYNEKGEIIKTGINLGPLPVVAFDNDRGFQYGALLNIYNFGDGSHYPNPQSYWYIEGSAYTGGTMKFVLNYDNKYIFPGIRLSAGIGYYSDSALDFYGFNGYQSNYDLDYFKDYITFDDSKKGVKLQKKFEDKGTIQKGFYRLKRQMVKGKVDFTGKIVENFYWEAGYSFQWIKTEDFVPKGYRVLNGVAEEENNTLFGLYKKWGIIPENQQGGGIISAIRAGLVYDSRNVENNPTKGIWAEAHVSLAPKWLGSSHGHYKVGATMRQYVRLGTEKVVFAYRLGYDGFLGKNTPWYAMPFYTSMGKETDTDAFGGYRTVRGVMLERLQGKHLAFYNVEVRYRFIDFKLWKQNISFALSAFTDGGHVFKGYDLSKRSDIFIADPSDATGKADLYDRFVNPDRRDGLHGSAGVGLRFIMNQNFIVAFEYARCFNKQDGKGAFYMNTGFLF